MPATGLVSGLSGSLSAELSLSAEELLQNAQIPGYNLAVSETGMTQARISPLTAQEVAGSVVDSSGGPLPLLFAGNGFTNLVPEDLTDVGWEKVSSGEAVDPVVTNPNPGVYRISVSHSGATGISVVRAPFNLGTGSKHGTCQLCCLNGTLPDTAARLSFRVGTTVKGTPIDLYSIDSSFDTYETSVASGNSTDNFTFYFEGTGTATIEVRFMRAVDSAIKHQPHAIGTGAGNTISSSLLSCSPTHGATGTIKIPIFTYGWSDTDNPAATQCTLASMTGLDIGLDASGFFVTSTGAVSTKKPVDGTLSIVTVSWDGVNHSISVDGESPVSVASAVVPSGDLYVGNVSGGTTPAHAALNALIWEEELTSGQSTEVDTFLGSYFAGFQYKA